jgi:DNA-binding transcriptional LysR family regulator
MNLYEEDLNLLLIYEALLETRSVSKASERLNVSQPSMSNALARLRKAFDDPMFVRVKNTMEPTPRALSIEAPIKDILSRARAEVFQKHTFSPALSSQTFTLCMTDLAQAAYLPKIINSVQAEAPNAKLRAITPIAERMEEGLESGTVDLAVGYFPDVNEAGVFQQRLLRNSGFSCIVGRDNVHLEDGCLTAETFARAPHVAIRTEGRSHEVIDMKMSELGISRRLVVTIPNFLGLLSIIPQTELMAVIPNDLARIFQRQEAIEVHPLPFESPRVAVTQVWHRRYDKDEANKWLRTLVKTCLGDL